MNIRFLIFKKKLERKKINAAGSATEEIRDWRIAFARQMNGFVLLIFLSCLYFFPSALISHEKKIINTIIGFCKITRKKSG